MAVPAEIPVTTPAFVTVAIAELLLVQLPPVVGVNVVVEFKQIELGPVILTVGKAFTFTAEVVLKHPVDVWVKVKVAIPADKPVTIPPFVTEAIEGLLLTHVPPDAGIKEVVAFTQKEETPSIPTVGGPFIVTADVVLLHPVLVWVKVKVAVPTDKPVTTPAFVTEATEGLIGSQVPPVVGDKEVVEFKQIEAAPVIFTAGKSFTVTPEVVLLHPVEAFV